MERSRSRFPSAKPSDALGRLVRIALDALFPIQCLGCGVEERGWACQPCLEKIRIAPRYLCPFCERPTGSGTTCEACRNKRPLDGALSMLPYAHPLIQSLIHAWKYQGIAALAEPLGSIVARGIDAMRAQGRREARQFLASGAPARLGAGVRRFPAPLFGANALLVPVPLHRKKLKERGFNQAEELARALAARQKAWRVENLLVRARRTHAQATLSGSDRITNARGAFRMRSENMRLNGAHILLVDDVITTASTCEEAARVLKNAGAASVWAITIAYGHPLHAT